MKTLLFLWRHPLTRQHPLLAVLRYVRWQLGSRLVCGDVVHEWINGARFFVRRGEAGLTGNIYTGLHEYDDMAFLLHFLRQGDIFIDVGANVGSYTVLACAVVGAEGYAFEPVPSTYLRLVENVRLNHLESTVRCINMAVGAELGAVLFTADSDTTNHAVSTSDVGCATVEVKVTTLDLQLNDVNPALIKIDVEGYETLVLQGGKAVLGKPSLMAAIIELNGGGGRYGFDEQLIMKTMADHGFSPFRYAPLDRKLVPLLGKNALAGNTLFIRDLNAVNERIQTAAKVQVLGLKF